MTTTMTIRLDEKLKAQLEKLALVTHRSKSFLAVEAISEYIKMQEWQISEIKKGIAEADSEQVVDHESVVKRWEKKRANSMDKRR